MSAYAASERRIGVTKESWHLQQMPRGDLLAYIESADLAGALTEFSRSGDEFDQWFKRRMAEVTGADLNDAPGGPVSEQLSSYQA